jgi:hypothetical protein
MFMIFFFKISRGVLEKIDFYIFRFYWQSDDHKKILVGRVEYNLPAKRSGAGYSKHRYLESLFIK